MRASITKTRLTFEYGKFLFDLELRGKIISVGGDSGTGKTLMFNKLLDMIKNYNLTGVSCFNASLKPDDLRSLIFKNRNELVIIDNADLLLLDSDDPGNLLKFNNRYILYTRNPQFYGIPDNCQARLVCKELKNPKTGERIYKFTLSYLW